jgi:hypothetical protein
MLYKRAIVILVGPSGVLNDQNSTTI